MSMETIFNNINAAADVVTNIIKASVEAAKTVEEFRQQISAHALEGDLDDAYYKMSQANQARQDFVDQG